MASKNLIIGIIVIIVVIIFGFIYLGGEDTSNSQDNQNNNPLNPTNEDSQGEDLIIQPEGSGAVANLPPDDPPTEDDSLPLWFTSEFKDVNTGNTYSVQSLNDKPVLMEIFAVWCPTCTKQQKETQKLHEEIGDEAYSISLDTDQGEDEAFVLAHAQSFGFDWRYSISPVDVTQSLIDSFGLGIINAPQAPIVLICPDGSYRQLDTGVKKVNELKEELATCG